MKTKISFKDLKHYIMESLEDQNNGRPEGFKVIDTVDKDEILEGACKDEITEGFDDEDDGKVNFIVGPEGDKIYSDL